MAEKKYTPNVPNDEEAKKFEENYRNAYDAIDKGITLVTKGKNSEASKYFENGLKFLDDALNLKIESLDAGASQMQLYAEMQNKMKITRKEVLAHFSDSQLGVPTSSGDQFLPEEAPPSYEDYLNSLPSEEREEATGNKNVQYPSLDPKNLKLQNMDFASASALERTTPSVTPVMSPQNGQLIFQIEDGVQIFFIYPDGAVTSPSHPSFLYIFTFPEPICGFGAANSPGTRGFLQMGEWSYPLIPCQSPVLHSFYGAYMFPDPSNPVPGASVGILIPDSVTKDERELFEQILCQLTSFQEQQTPEGVSAEEEKAKLAETAGHRIAEGLVAGAEAVSKGVVWSAEKLSGLIAYGSEKLKESIIPERQQRTVDPKWQKTAEVARNVSGTAVRVSGYLLGQVGKATNALGKRLAPAIQRHGTKAVTRLTGQTEKVSDAQVGSVMEVASGAVKGVSTIYMGLESAAATLATSLSDNTVKVVTHKYGSEYGQLTDHTLHTVGQTAMAGHNISSLGVKGVAKRAARETGKALVGDYEEKKKQRSAAEKLVTEEETMDGIEEAVEVKEKTENDKS